MKFIRAFGNLEKGMDMVKHIFLLDMYLTITRATMLIINAAVKDF